MRLFSILACGFIFLLNLIRIQANDLNALKELRTRSAVYHQARATCNDRWGAKIENLKMDVKKDSGPIYHHLSKLQVDATVADPAEVAAIAQHLCETGRFSRNVREERAWYRDLASGQPVTYSSPIESEAIGENSLGDVNLDTTLEDNSSLSTSSFMEQPILSFIFGLVLGICLAQCILLKRAGIIGDTVPVHKLRRPEL